MPPSNHEPTLPASAEPLRVAHDWLAEARAAGTYRNPGAMALATADSQGRPTVRMVLVKEFSVRDGFATFYTNYESRKGHELASNARTAGVLYWEQLGRQLRLEGIAVRSPAAESDAYFASRPLGSRINAWVSDQSRPIADFAELERRLRARRSELESTGADCVRPDHWGGFRIWLDRIEFWVEGSDRFHERVQYERTLSASGQDRFAGSAWTRALLQP